jgi:mono/diheme cytochrome c family protein
MTNSCTSRRHRFRKVISDFVLRASLGLWVLGYFVIPSPAAAPSEAEKLFALKVKPLFNEKCMACHGNDPDKIKGDFDMRARSAMLKGGAEFESKSFIPGKGEASFLYKVTTRTVEDYEMPPKEADRLTEEQTWWIRDWINAGAPWPSDERVSEIEQKYAEGVIVPTSGGLGEDWTNRRYKPEHLWAYQPLKVEPVAGDVNSVDWFINQGLKAAGLKPAPTAAPRELARRISFGLTGLPPLPNAARRFEAALKKDPRTAVLNYAKQLMSTKHYGEHFGRQWLDVARYADSAGFANDYSRPNAWRFRDYVVRAFNDDKPYNEFVREQVAGDEIDSEDPEKVIATGFLRMGPWEQTGMSVFRVTRQQWLDDVTDSVGQTFLAHPLQCAKCHDHKFDPIPTRDYYSMMAVFSTTQFAERNTPFLKQENKTWFKEANDWTTAKVQAYQKQRNELNAEVKKNRKKETGDAKVGDNGLDPGDEASLARMGKNISRHTWEFDKVRPIAFAVHTGKTIERKNVSSRTVMPKKPWAKGYLEEDTILTGGDAYSHGAKVTPGPISAATKLGGMKEPTFPADRGERRLALADWIVDQQNPLTARVMVNRVWTWHFGQGLAGNPNNFGATGKLPTHPELLDHLANWFMDNGWSVKKLNELILSSNAYRRSTRHPNAAVLAEKDPKGELYATFRPRRLAAEEIRDAMLAASGELNRMVGGIPCRPDINMEVAMQPRQIMGGTASVYEPDPKPQQRNRRTIYAEKIRGVRDPFMETFNQPGPDKSCELRETSTVAPQALTLLNAEEVNDRALAFAARAIEESKQANAVIRRVFELALARPPTATELKTCREHWERAVKEESGKQYTAKKYASITKRTVMAEKTGEPYDFIEHMPAYENYVPDLQPADTDARTRGLAQVCLVIFNLNEFAYLD